MTAFLDWRPFGYGTIPVGAIATVLGITFLFVFLLWVVNAFAERD